MLKQRTLQQFCTNVAPMLQQRWCEVATMVLKVANTFQERCSNVAATSPGVLGFVWKINCCKIVTFQEHCWEVVTNLQNIFSLSLWQRYRNAAGRLPQSYKTTSHCGNVLLQQRCKKVAMKLLFSNGAGRLSQGYKVTKYLPSYLVIYNIQVHIIIIQDYITLLFQRFV